MRTALCTAMSLSLLLGGVAVAAPNPTAAETAPDGAPGAAVDADAAASKLASSISDPNSMFRSLTENGKAGDWVEYAQYVDGKPSYAHTMRMMVLGDVNSPQQTVEFWFDKVGSQAARLHVDESGKLEFLFKMGRAIYTLGDGSEKADSPMCLGGTCGSGGTDHQHKGKGDEVEEVTVKTLAGSFKCKHVKRHTRDGVLEVWYSPEVPGLGLVRLKSFDSGGLELVAFGREGRSAFPKKFTPQPLPLSQIGAYSSMLPSIDSALTRDLQKMGETSTEPMKEEPSSCEPGTPGCSTPAPEKK